MGIVFDHTIEDITYGNGIFVAVTFGGGILASPDGINWTERPSGVSHSLYGVSYGSGVFVAAGAYGTILTSTDGVIWTERPSGTGNWLKVNYVNGNFFVIGTFGTILQPSPFSDFPLDFWAFDYIQQIYDAGITVGCRKNLFCPQNPVARAQAAAFIIRALEGEPEVTSCLTQPFKDVPTDHPFCKHIERMKVRGITTGFPDGTFRPSSYVSRAQAAAFIVRALEGDYVDICKTQPFPDVSMNQPFCKHIERMKELGIATGFTDGTFGQGEMVTRAAMAAFLARAFLDGPRFQTTLILKDADGVPRNEFFPGENITFELAISNIRDSSQALNFSDSQLYDFLVASDAQLIWNWAHDKVFAQVLTRLDFAPFETKTFSVVWDQRDNEGVQIPAGTYQTQGFIATQWEKLNPALAPESETRSPVVTFTVR